ADQASGRDGELQVDLAAAVVHADQLALAVAHQLHNAAHVLLGHVDDEVLDGLEERAVLVAAHDDLRLADAQLVALAAHVLDEDAQVQQAAPAHLEGVLVFGLLDLQGDVGLQLLHQPLAEVAAGDVLALAAGEGRVVDAEHHGQRRRLDVGGLERLGVEEVADAVGDVDRVEADQRDDVSGGGLVDGLAAQSVEHLDLLGLGLHDLAIALDDADLLAALDAAVVDAADADAA